MRAHAGKCKAIDTKQEVMALIRCRNVACRWSSERPPKGEPRSPAAFDIVLYHRQL